MLFSTCSQGVKDDFGDLYDLSDVAWNSSQGSMHSLV